MSKRYLIILGLFAALVLSAAVSVNIVYDPAGIYRVSSNSSKEYANRLIQSHHGLFFKSHSWNDRKIKIELAQSVGEVDCVIIGSSHAMQLSSFRKKSSLGEMCEKIFNLAVSGALLEDHIALSFAATNANQKPNKIIFCIDPWVFHIGKGLAWQNAYPDVYMDALKELEQVDTLATNSDRFNSAKLSNLLSLEYTIRSIKKAIFLAANGKESIKDAPSFDEEVGLEDSVLLPDGSIIYSAKKIYNSKVFPVPLIEPTYLTEGTYYDLNALELYRRHIRSLINKGVTPVFLLTPYHPKVWANINSKNRLTMEVVEPLIRKLANQLGIDVLGSFDPKIIGCKPNEFMDFQHATIDCIIRIKNTKL